jgi:nicotinamide-nucleotide amidase
VPEHRVVQFDQPDAIVREDMAAALIVPAPLLSARTAAVESCTAGALAHLLADAEGASTVLHGGFVVYTKENKIAAVGVPPELLRTVSAPVARAMTRLGTRDTGNGRW